MTSRRSHWITDLPYELCIEILSELWPDDLEKLHFVSHDTHRLLSSDAICTGLLSHWWPRSREARIARKLRHERCFSGLDETDWLQVLRDVARRYKTLQAGSWEDLDGINPASHSTARPSVRTQTVQPWRQMKVFVDQRWDFEERFRRIEPMWTYSAEDSLLVYPTMSRSGAEEHCLLAEDLETGQATFLPFDCTGKTIRRLRLKQHLLVIEWCYSIGSWVRDTVELASPHFATIISTWCPTDDNGRLPLKHGRVHKPWQFRVQASWQISTHDYTSRDRFFSAHNRTHYVLYTWRCEEDESREREELRIWQLDIHSGPCERTGDLDQIGLESGLGAQLLHSWGYEDLSTVWKVSQGDQPAMVNIQLDDCTWDVDSQSGCGHIFIHSYWHPHLHAAQDHSVSSTGIPLAGIGPCWWEGCSTHWNWDSACPRFPFRLKCFSWPGRAPCWRHHRDASEGTKHWVIDEEAGIQYTATQREYSDYEEFLEVSPLPDRHGEPRSRRQSRSAIELGFGNSYLLMGSWYFEGDGRRLVGQPEHGGEPQVLTFSKVFLYDY